MRFSLSWIKNYVDIKVTPQELAEKLSQSLSEIESIEYKGNGLEKIIVGQIVELYKHPNADKLQVSKVNIGSENLQIVTGASNVSVNDKVPIVLSGGKVSGKVVEKTELRGIESNGMMCSQRELELGEDHSGIYILPADTEIGKSLDKQLKDTIFSIENKSLTNRPDCFSHKGIAREIAAIFELPFEDSQLNPIPIDINFKEDLEVIIDSQFCKRYSAAVIKNVKIEPSALWLQIRLMHMNMRPVNNIVDITNYIMLDLGQPLHAFDKRNVDKKISVRTATIDERIQTIDHKDRNLDTNSLLITSKDAVLGIAGIMGGSDSEISNDTKDIILESANFDYANIRTTSRKLGLSTDASIRFEKKLDPEQTITALTKALEMIGQLANGTTSQIVDVYPNPVKPKKLSVKKDYVNKLLGTNLTQSEINTILKRLFIVDGVIPSFRQDLNTSVDLIEEVARIYGYENFQPSSATIELPKVTEYPGYDLEIKAENTLLALGLDFVHTHSFLSKKLLETFKFNLKNLYHIQNPLSENYEYLRPLIILNLINLGRENLKSFETVNLFETGKVFNNKQESKSIGIVLFKKDFFYIKGIIESLFESLRSEFELSRDSVSDLDFLHPNKSAVIKSKGDVLGFVGILNPTIASELGIKDSIAVAEINFETLIKASDLDIKFKQYSKYQEVSYDFNFEIPKDREVGSIIQRIKEKQIPEIINAAIIDIFNKDNIKIVTTRVTLQSDTHTLTETEIEELRKIILS